MVSLCHQEALLYKVQPIWKTYWVNADFHKPQEGAGVGWGGGVGLFNLKTQNLS